MKIKEFANKHSLVFFYTTIILAILALLTCIASVFRYGDRYEYGRGMMRRDNGDYYNGRGRMMNNQPYDYRNDQSATQVDDTNSDVNASSTQ